MRRLRWKLQLCAAINLEILCMILSVLRPQRASRAKTIIILEALAMCRGRSAHLSLHELSRNEHQELQKAERFSRSRDASSVVSTRSCWDVCSNIDDQRQRSARANQFSAASILLLDAVYALQATSRCCQPGDCATRPRTTWSG